MLWANREGAASAEGDGAWAVLLPEAPVVGVPGEEHCSRRAQRGVAWGDRGGTGQGQLCDWRGLISSVACTAVERGMGRRDRLPYSVRGGRFPITSPREGAGVRDPEEQRKGKRKGRVNGPLGHERSRVPAPHQAESSTWHQDEHLFLENSL